MRKTDEKIVLVWRRDVLPGSETFIRNQLNSLTDWHGSLLGIRRINSSLSDDKDLVVYENAFFSRIARRAFGWSHMSIKILVQMKKLNPALVHSHFGTDAVLIAPICRMLRIPLVVTLHGVDVTALAQRPGFRGSVYRRQLRRVFKQAAQIIAVSEFIADKAMGLGATRRNLTVHHIGIPLDAVDPEPCQETEWDIVAVGRLVEKKGIADLISAVELLKTRVPSIRVAIVGAGVEGESLKRQASHMGESISFLGALPPESVREVMLRSRIAVVPSKTAQNGDTEGLPMVLVEAGALGIPTVATRHSGIPEIIRCGFNGILCEEGDVDAIADAIFKLLSNVELSQFLGNNARNIVRQEFDVKVQTLLLEGIYDKAIKG